MTIKHHVQPTIKSETGNPIPTYDRESWEQQQYLAGHGAACAQNEETKALFNDIMEINSKRKPSTKPPKKLESLEVAAKQICEACVVREECEDFALPRYESFRIAIVAAMNYEELKAKAQCLDISQWEPINLRAEPMQESGHTKKSA